MTLAAAIFDMDGVLIDSEPLHLQSTNDVIGRWGHALTVEQNEAYLGWNENAYWEALRERFSLTATSEELIEARHVRLIELLKEELPIVDGVREVVADFARRGFALAVASSSEREAIDFVLEHGGLAEHFPVIASGDEVANSKPDPEIFLLAAERLGKRPEECVVFEDSLNGVNAAVAAGMTCLRVMTDMTRNIPFPPVDGVIESFVGFQLEEALQP